MHLADPHAPWTLPMLFPTQIARWITSRRNVLTKKGAHYTGHVATLGRLAKAARRVAGQGAMAPTHALAQKVNMLSAHKVLNPMTILKIITSD